MDDTSTHPLPLEGEAPPSRGLPRSTQLQMAVIAAGLTTTVLALVGVYLINAYANYHIMGLYGNYILPMGAILVGLAASSGYGAALWAGGVKIHGRLLVTIMSLLGLGYFLAQYIEFSQTGPYLTPSGIPVTFPEYFHETAINFAWIGKDGRVGAPLGMWGYLFKALEIVGFVGGGLIIPLVLRQSPYCEGCQLYMKTRNLALLPASVPPRKLKRRDTEAHAALEKEQAEALAAGKACFQTLLAQASQGDIEAVKECLAAAKIEKKAVGKLPARIQVNLVHCRQCNHGYLAALLLSGAKGETTSQEELEKAPLAPESVSLICAA